MYDNIDSLFKDLQKDIKEVISNEVSKAGKDCLKNAIDRKVYSRIPKVYQRTYTLKDSVNAKVLFQYAQAELSFYNNPNMMLKTRYPSTMKNRSQDNTKFISQWINDGHTLWGKGFYKKTNYMELAENNMETIVRRALVNGLKARGYKAKSK